MCIIKKCLASAVNHGGPRDSPRDSRRLDHARRRPCKYPLSIETSETKGNRFRVQAFFKVLNDNRFKKEKPAAFRS
jgi:hypothetical protein